MDNDFKFVAIMITILNSMSDSDKIQLGLLFVTIVGLIISICINASQNRNLNRQLKLNFFADYTKRYHEIILHFPEDINSKKFNYKKLSDLEYKRTLRLMRTYFDLCSEEFYLNQQSHIASYIWKQWKLGMEHAMTKKAFREAWDKISKDTYYDDGFIKFISSLKKENLSNN